MTTSATVRKKQNRGGSNAAVLTLLPLTLIILFFFVVPILGMLVTSLQEAGTRGSGSNFTLENYAALATGTRAQALKNSAVVSLTAATVAAVLGLVVAWGLSFINSKTLDSITGVVSSVLANSGGVPLAFSFIVLVGNTGYLTSLLLNIDPGFSLYSVEGLVLMYQYFLIPTMVLLTLPSFQAMRKSWKEANTSLGGTAWTFWKRVGIPIITPTVIGAWVLLFGSAFATHASAAVLMGSGSFPLVTLQIAGELSSSATSGGENVAMAMGITTTVIAIAVLIVFNWLQGRSQKWLQN